MEHHVHGWRSPLPVELSVRETVQATRPSWANDDGDEEDDGRGRGGNDAGEQSVMPIRGVPSEHCAKKAEWSTDIFLIFYSICYLPDSFLSAWAGLSAIVL